ncbi:DUF4397 domain-containing protein [Plantactinospora soyae]|uniref:DUF4397 domain-containing protein n=1 Tax=Plantactinospora soyae TaxID=1544732 RepID=A0A927MG69_9ACTN|nr:DUF4397 domain-containing protein [Plantactinospora soyae]MBE1492446.1 hypothetical protein [Plantactinospora soyae]
MEHTTTPQIRIGRRIAAGAAALGLGLGLGLASIVPAPANAGATVGYVRLAHLSPDTPAVDVYLGAATDSTEPQVFKAVGYGVLSPYLPLPVGPYVVAMRRAGAAATDPPVLTERVSVAAGKAYTVAGVGRYAELGLKVLDDDLTAPPDGRAKVRVVQASVRAPVIDVSVAEGASIASGVQFATTTAYHQVAPGRSTLRLSATGAKPTTVDVSLTDGTVYSLLVLDAKQSGLTTELRVDARGGVVVPTGGVDTGAGGTAGRSASTYPIGLASVGALLAVVVAATGRRLRQRRPRRTS